MNSAFARHRGVTPEEGTGRLYEELLPGKIADQTRLVDDQVIQSQEVVEQIEVHPDFRGNERSWLVFRFPMTGPTGDKWVAGTALDITERQRLESENKLMGFALENATFAFYLVDSKARFLMVNEASCRQTGYSRQELLSMTVHDLDPDFPEEKWDGVWSHLQQQGSLNVESRHIRKDGSWFPIEVEANFIKFEGREYNVVFVRDITQRKEALEKQSRLQEELEHRIAELEENRKKTALLTKESHISGFGLEHAAVAYFLGDENAKVLLVNKAACRQNGFTEEEFLTMKVWDFCPKITPEMWPELWQQLKAQKFVRQESLHLRKDGSTFPVEIERNSVEFEGKGYNYAFVRDITERKEWEETLEKRVHERTIELQSQRQETLELAAENALVSYALKNASVAFFLINAQAKILRVNTAASKQTGYSQDELLNMHVYDLDPDFPKEAWPDHWKDLQKHKFLRFETRHLHKGGLDVPKEVEANYVEFEGERYNMAFVRDISERRKWMEKKESLQTELEKRVDELSRSNEELDRFAYAASHDLKSPLLNIHFLLDLIKEDTGNNLPEPITENFDKLQNTVTRMETLLESLLSYSRVGQAEDIPSQLDLQHLLNEVIAMLVLPPSVTVNIPDDLPNVIAPRGAMIRIFSNLINNALKHAEQYNLRIDISWQDLGDHHILPLEITEWASPSITTNASSRCLNPSIHTHKPEARAWVCPW